MVLVTGRNWQRSEAAEGRWGSLTKCRGTEFMTLRRVYEVQRSSPSTHIPRVEVFWSEDPRRTVVPRRSVILAVEGK